VFLDRDGVINVYLPGDYVRKASQFKLIEGADQAIRQLNDAGVLVILISNQQGVGKGLMTMGDLKLVGDEMDRLLLTGAGAHLDRAYYCPHLKSDACECRKPKPGMLLQAACDYNLQLENTAFIGDSSSDMQAAYAAGVGKRILVLTGAPQPEDDNHAPHAPDVVVSGLDEAVAAALAGGRIGACACG
jgi:D-glycero-D-manno-heptose 1,7-bisphosphate phosphatase